MQSVTARCETPRFHRKQASLHIRVRRSALQNRFALPCERNSFVRLIEVAGQMTHTAEHMCTKLPVTTNLDKRERPAKVLFCNFVTARIVRHPASHLSKRSRSGEYRHTRAPISPTEKPRSHVGL